MDIFDFLRKKVDLGLSFFFRYREACKFVAKLNKMKQ